MFPLLHYDYVRGFDPRLPPVIDRILGGKVEMASAAVALDGRLDSTRILQLQIMADYARWGRQVFVLGPRFQEMLARTAIGSVPRERLNMPFPCFYLALQDSPWSVIVPESGAHQVTGLYVQATPTEARPDIITIFVWGAENQNSRWAGDDASVWVRLYLNEAYANAGNLESHLEETLTSSEEDSSPGMGSAFQSDAEIKHTRETMVRLLRVVLNMVLYIQSKNAEAVTDNSSIIEKREAIQAEMATIIARSKNKKKGEKKAHRKAKELQALPDARVTWLAQETEKQFDKIHGIQTGERGKRVPHWVRGYWWPIHDTARHKAHERWVQPHPRCVADGEAIPDHQYWIKEDSEVVLG